MGAETKIQWTDFTFNPWIGCTTPDRHEGQKRRGSSGMAGGSARARISKGDEIMKRGPKPGTPRKRFLRDQPGIVRRIHAEHLSGSNLRALELKFGYRHANIKRAFERLGLEVRMDPTLGHFPRTMRRHTDDEILAMARNTKRVIIPHALRTEWREWPLEKRWWLIEQLVAIHGWAFEMPTGPYSDNVVPFHYGTPAAHETAAALNQGRSSQQWQCHLKICSRGVIYGGQLWSYVPDNGYVHGTFRIGQGRQRLHRELYLAHHGEIPADCVVRFRDGNENNLDPANLYLATRNELGRENQARHLEKLSRAKMAALLNHSQNKKKGTHDQITRLLGSNPA